MLVLTRFLRVTAMLILFPAAHPSFPYVTEILQLIQSAIYLLPSLGYPSFPSGTLFQFHATTYPLSPA